MQKLTCPWCGPRAQTEFEYHGDDSVVDTNFANESAGAAFERVFLRHDYMGFHREIWQHVLGCRGWLRLERHNRTHEIRSAEPCRRETGRGGDAA